MKYKVELTVKGYLEIEASSELEAREMVEDGFSPDDFYWQDDDIDDVRLIPE